jgi:integrase/recombinase XerD
MSGKSTRTKGFENIRRLRTRAELGKQMGGTHRQAVPAPDNDLAASKRGYLHWLEGRQLAAQTLNHRKADLDQFFHWAEERGLDTAAAVTLSHLESYQRWLGNYRKKDGKPLSHRTLRGRLSTLQDYFRWLVRHGLLGANPASELVLPHKVSRLLEQALSLGQVDELLAQFDLNDLLGLRDRVMIELLYATAIRLGELNKLELRDVYRPQKTLFIRQGKGHKDRIVPLGERALHWLERYLEEVRPRLELHASVQTIFLTGYGHGFHPNALGALIRKHLRTVGIAKGGSHLLRHTCATHLLEGGADIRFIQKLLGHASLETTAIYTEMNVESLRQVFTACHPAEKRWQQAHT